MKLTEQRDGEIVMASDPAGQADGTVCFIGRVQSAWKTRAECPKNMEAARETGRPARIEIAPEFRPGLLGLDGYSHAVILSWFDRAQRNLIVQKPRHATEPKGVFGLRSPVRPNPIGLHIVRLTGLDIEAGVVGIDAIDLLDGTPILDIKPYFAVIDAFPDATRPTK